MTAVAAAFTGRPAGASAPANRYEAELIAECARCYADPLRFVRVMYPWPIQGERGPDAWQRDVLAEIGAAVRDRGYDPDRGESVAPIRKATVRAVHGR